MSQEIGHGGGAIIMKQSQNITSNTTLSSGSNYMTIGPQIDVNSGVTLTIESGATLTVLAFE